MSVTAAATFGYKQVHNSYSFRAENEATPELRGRIAAALGYDPMDVAAVPDQANIGEGCGNPLLIAHLAKGETVVDLGSGGGLDVILASKKVGPRGKVIGIDMTEKMVQLGRRNAANAGITNVEFLLSKISSIALPSNTVNCILSNCVLNLVPDEDKRKVFQEIHRVLKPGGRIAISDFLAYKPLPQEMKNDPDLIAGCVSGAIEASKMEDVLRETGFTDILLIDAKMDLNLYKDDVEKKSASVTPCCSGSSGSCKPTTRSGRKELDYDLKEWIGSFQIYALKSSDQPITNAPVSAGVTEKQPQSSCGCEKGRTC